MSDDDMKCNGTLLMIIIVFCFALFVGALGKVIL